VWGMTVAVHDEIHEQLSTLYAGGFAALPDPYPLYRRLREEAPVYFYDDTTVIISRHADAKLVYRSPDRFPNPEERFTMFGAAKLRLLSPEDVELYRQVTQLEAAYLSRLNGERHRRVRAAGQRVFTPRRIEFMRERISALTEQLLDELAAQGEGTVEYTDFAFRLPLLVIMDMFGAPYEDAAKLRHWGDAINAPSGQMPLQAGTVHEAHACAQDYHRYVRDLVARQREGGETTGLVSALLDASAADQLTDDELVAIYVLLLFAGHETTANMLTNGLRAFMEHRDQWQLLCSDPSLAARATEEVLRFEAPAQTFKKCTVAAQAIAGVRIPAGAFVACGNAAANRDPAVFERADELDITRAHIDHLSFGYGTHFCLGAVIARMEGEIAFAALARRFPDIELAVDPSELGYLPHANLRGLASAPVRLGRDRR
jgi:cytochrome P450